MLPVPRYPRIVCPPLGRLFSSAGFQMSTGRSHILKSNLKHYLSKMVNGE